MTLEKAIASMRDRPAILTLRGAVQHYQWGGYDSIPRIIGVENPERKPYAELWIGAHPKAPSLVEIDGASFPLDSFIARASAQVLGGATAKRFAGELPFLLKLPGNPEATRYERPFNTIVIHDLLLGILRRDFTTPAAVMSWLDARNMRPDEIGEPSL